MGYLLPTSTGVEFFRFLKQSTVHQQYITFRKSLDDQISWGWQFFFGEKILPHGFRISYPESVSGATPS